MTRFMRLAVCLSDLAGRAAESLLCVLGGGMALLIGAQVFCRYGLNHSLFWAEEVGRMCVVWITFLGASAAYRRHQHVGIDFLVRRLPDRLQAACAFGVWAVSMALFGVMLIYGSRFVSFVGTQKTPALGMPMKIPYVIIPVSGAFFLVHGLRQLVEYVQGRRG